MPKAQKPDIDEMAWKHLTRHPNDKSGSIFSKMKRRFGREQAIKAIRRISKTAKLLDQKTAPLTLEERGISVSGFSKSGLPKWDSPADPVYIAMDEASPVKTDEFNYYGYYIGQKLYQETPPKVDSNSGSAEETQRKFPFLFTGL